MLTRILFAIVLTLAFATPNFAQAPWQFQWQKGQVLKYKIKHVTSVLEVVDKNQNTSSSSSDLVNHWEVSDVDAKGVATLSMKLVSMRHEQKRLNGETLLFDSQNLEKSTPELRDQMSKFIGQTHVVIRLDGYGRVIEVKKGTADYEWEPPFVVVFPSAKAEAGQAWRRPFKLVIAPPLGTGEKYEAEQRYECKKIEAGKATITVSTQIKSMPDNATERLPLLHKDVQGELVFDVQAGRLISAQLNIDKMLENHKGKGSSYQFKSQYWRELVE